MQKRLLSQGLRGYGTSWWPNRRILIDAGTLAVLLIVAGSVAWFTGSGTRNDAGPDPAASAPASAAPGQPAPQPAPGSGSVPAPPRIADPVAYARAAAVMLWSYDTRTTSRDQQLAGMSAWMSKETKYTDWSSIAAQVPDPVLWSRMADQTQYATAQVTEGHYPSAFKAALAENPSALTEAYIYAVTVTGKQSISWKQGGGGAEDRSVTLAVQCRPGHDCTLVALAPRVAP
ncbi:hypothetical protein [Streptomyces sp. NPDC059928]|uniref:hypothetical protein n=1 Tax=unclassified Streptomyces TaxID=2593676 RepID=UPI0036663727